MCLHYSKISHCTSLCNATQTSSNKDGVTNEKVRVLVPWMEVEDNLNYRPRSKVQKKALSCKPRPNP